MLRGGWRTYIPFPRIKTTFRIEISLVHLVSKIHGQITGRRTRALLVSERRIKGPVTEWNSGDRCTQNYAKIKVLKEELHLDCARPNKDQENEHGI